MSEVKVIKSTNIFTGRGSACISGAIGIRGDKIVAVGECQKVLEALEGDRPQVIDYEDAFIVPGFHDSHLHFFHSALYSSTLARRFVGENEQDCVKRMQEFAAAKKEGWLLAQGWREYLWNIPKMPSRESLDKAFPDRCVALYSGDAHTLWVNSVALRELGISESSVAPEGGQYCKDENGKLTGIIREAAAMECMAKIVAAFSDAEIKEAYRGFLCKLAKNGITSVCDMSLMAMQGMDFIRDDIYASLLAQGQLTSRVHMYPTLLLDKTRFNTMRSKYDKEEIRPYLQVSGFKQFYDGVSSQHTAWLTEDYTNARFKGDRGNTTVSEEEMRELIFSAQKLGEQVRIHTIGDAAIHSALNIFEEATKKFGRLKRGRRHVLEHVENFLPQDLERMDELSVIASIQPPHITLDPGGPEKDLGLERVKYMWPVRTLLGTLAIVSFGTDSPVVDVNSRNVLYSATTRQDPKTGEPKGGWLPTEKIDMASAIRAYTYGSAWSCSRQHELGLLEAGMYADIAILDNNLLACEEDAILKANVVATYLGGKQVY